MKMGTKLNHVERVQKHGNAIRRKVRTILKAHGLEDFTLSNIELVNKDGDKICRFVIGDDGIVHKKCD